jgi:hypothetical protein
MRARPLAARWVFTLEKEALHDHARCRNRRRLPCRAEAQSRQMGNWHSFSGLNESHNLDCRWWRYDYTAEATNSDTATVRARIGSDVKLRVCFESGYDGFWLARFLISQGIDTCALDPTSFLVSRRGRRVKTDRIDVEACLPPS